LGDDVYVAERWLVNAVHSDGRFTDVLPGLSHGTLTLSEDSDRPYARQLRLTPLSSGGYMVLDTGTHAFRQVETLNDALDVLARFRDY
jgi:hypothetical protein